MDGMDAILLWRFLRNRVFVFFVVIFWLQPKYESNNHKICVLAELDEAICCKQQGLQVWKSMSECIDWVEDISYDIYFPVKQTFIF